MKRFLDRCWKVAKNVTDAALTGDAKKTTHKTIDKVTGDIDAMRFNTAISAMMVMSKELEKAAVFKRGQAGQAARLQISRETSSFQPRSRANAPLLYLLDSSTPL